MTKAIAILDEIVADRKAQNPEAFAFGEAMADKALAFWKLISSMVEASGLKKAEIAQRMRTSPTAVSRMLNPDNAGSISMRTLFKLEYATEELALRYADECRQCRSEEKLQGFEIGLGTAAAIGKATGGWKTVAKGSAISEDARTPIPEDTAGRVSWTRQTEWGQWGR